MNQFLIHGAGLGDRIASLYMLENTGIQKNIKFEVNIDVDVSSIHFKNITLNNNAKNDFWKIVRTHQYNQISKEKCHGIINGHFLIVATLNYLQYTYGYDPNLSIPLCTNIKNKSKKTYVQFDCRTSRLQNRDMSIKKKINIASKLSCASVIGGFDTCNYLGNNFSYELGDLKFIIEKISNSTLFVGCDSGISHIAGALGIESKVYIKKPYECLVRYYKSYNNCKLIRLTL
jgi:hypothetical protein